MNTGAPWPTLSMDEAEARVLGIQTKLHQWATDDPTRRFDDLYNLVCDPAVLVEAWGRVRGNRGARTAGVDGETAHYITAVRGVSAFLSELRAELKARGLAQAARFSWEETADRTWQALQRGGGSEAIPR